MSSIDNLPFNAPPPATGFGGPAFTNFDQPPFGAAAAQPDGVASYGSSAWNPYGAYGSYGGTSFGSGALGGIMNGFSSFISNLFNEISGWFGGGGSPSPSPTAPGAPVSVPGSPVSAPAAPVSASGSPSPAGGEQFYSSARAASWGDPHDSFNGTGANGQSVGGKWDNMNSHWDLLDSNSFAGGLRVSTQVTQPNQDGVTHNQSATVTTNGGNTQVTMNANGTMSVTSYGQSYSLAPGQSINLGNGETVSAAQNGSLTVSMQNASGGTVAISLTAADGGVNVAAQAANVDLGGYLASRNGPAGTNPQPVAGSAPAPAGSCRRRSRSSKSIRATSS